jgi:ATP-binding cassette subfamily B protein
MLWRTNPIDHLKPIAMPFPFYRQLDAMDCGPTCLRIIAQHYGTSVPPQLLRDRSQLGKIGANMLGLTEAAESIGFRTRSVKLSFDVLVRDALLPCILFWDQYHFVVLYKTGRHRLHIADPARGLVRVTKEEFLEKWATAKSDTSSSTGDTPSAEGIALLLEPTRAFYTGEANPANANPAEANPAGTNPAAAKTAAAKTVAAKTAAAKTTHPEKKGLAFRNIIHYILPYKKLVVQLFLGLIVGSLLQLVLPFLAQSVVDIGIGRSNLHFIYLILLAQSALFIGRLGTDLIRSWILLHISMRINISIMADFLAKMLDLPISFFNSKLTGDILQRMNDHQRIETFLTGSSVGVLFSLANLIIFSFVLAFFNRTLFAVFAIATLLYSAWALIFLRYRRALDYKRFEVASKEQSATIQLVQGMQEIKLHGMEQPMRLNWEKLQASLFRLTMKGLSIKNWQQSGASFINEGKNILITFLSAKAVIEGHMTLGMMLAAQYIIGQLNSPIEQMIGFVQSWQDAKISMERLNEIHHLDDEEPEHLTFLQELPPAFARQLSGGRNAMSPLDYEENNPYPTLAENPAIPDAGRPGIVFSNVSFTYPGAGNLPVLQNIHLQIPQAKTTAIVGVSGSGKTTLLKLLLKFHQPQQGTISLGGVPLSDLSHKVWRSHCGVVMQDSFIFSDTIARNIAVGLEAIDPERLQHAITVAKMDDLIATLPLGLQTKIGSEGAGISTGQKQRILIARAVYRDPQFIFFDEATNSLDAHNESAIIHNLGSFFAGRTVVVVAHRLSTVMKADQIIVLDKGRIVEKGTHRQLINGKGYYFTLIKNQLDLGE